MSRSFTIDNRSIGVEYPPYIVAEISANHNGSLERAIETIDAAHQSGADAVKLQTYTADTMTIESDRPEFTIRGGPWDGHTLYDLYKWAETPYEWHEKLFLHARQRGITLFSSPFDESAVDLLEQLGAPAYKIASFELVDLPLIQYVARTGKPMIISTGMATELEIEEAVAAARHAGCEDIAVLHCVSAYPAPVDQANVRQVPELAKRYDVISGLSDHTLGTAAAVAAVALGACLIEKHFTMSRKDKGPDSEFSIEPAELSRLCRDANEAWQSVGEAGYEMQEAEAANRLFRRSLYFVRDLQNGAIIVADDIRRIRPGLGISPKHFDEIVGRRVSKPVTRGMPVSWDVIEGG